MTPRDTLRPHNICAPQTTTSDYPAQEIVQIERCPLVLLHRNNVHYVTLEAIAHLARYRSPESVERQLTYKLREVAENFPKGAIMTFTHPSGREQLALTLPHAIKLVSHFRSREFIALHHILLDVLTTHIPNMNALEKTECKE